MRRGKRRNDMHSAVVLLSGGLDSSTLLRMVVRREGCERVYALTMGYGQKHIREVDCAMRQAKAMAVQEHKVLDISCYGDLAGGASSLTAAGMSVPDLSDIPDSETDQPSTYVPNRNMILLSLAAAYAEKNKCNLVYYGAQQQDRYGYWDCTVEFVERINALLALNRRNPIEVRAPFALLRKSAVLRIGLELGLDPVQTWTCYRGGSLPCGRCPSCVERQEAFRELGLSDPLMREGRG